MILRMQGITMPDTTVNANEVIDALNDTIKAMSSEFRAVSPIISRIMLSDVQGHFVKGMGPNGQWKDLKESYKNRLGQKSRRSYLYKSGKLLRGIKENPLVKSARISVKSKYAKIHNFGGTPELAHNQTMPKREFMYLTQDAVSKILGVYTDFIRKKWDR